MIILYFHLQPQFKYELFHILHISIVYNLFFFITQTLTNAKLARPTVMTMRTVLTQRAHIIVVVKLDLQEMEPIARVRRVTEHLLFTMFKKHGRYRKRRAFF